MGMTAYSVNMTGAAPPPGLLAAPALVARHLRAVLFTPDGEILSLAPEDVSAALHDLPPPILVHAPAAFRR